MGEKGGPPRERHRAALVLSLIVLVWNTAATARQFLFSGLSGTAGDPVSSPGEPLQIPSATAVDCAVGARTGPLTFRQEFLLGKRIDVNKATWREISDLPGVSDEVAKRVVERRESKGPFRRPEDLLGVKGIKEKRLKKILPFLAKFPNN